MGQFSFINWAKQTFFSLLLHALEHSNSAHRYIDDQGRKHTIGTFVADGRRGHRVQRQDLRIQAGQGLACKAVALQSATAGLLYT